MIAIARDLLAALAPPHCVACSELTDDEAPFCGQCESALNQIQSRPACPACGVPLATTGASCTYCHGRSFYPYRQIVALGVFSGPLRQMVHHAKYHNRWTAAEILSERLLQQPHVRQVLANVDCIVPVPLHWRRQVSRGYNQSDVLARALAKGNRQAKVIHPVVRIRPTEMQVHTHSVQQRQDNVRNAFAVVKPQAVKSKRVLVVDDVMTTVATLKSVGRELRKAGVREMYAVVAAVADPRRRDFTAV